MKKLILASTSTLHQGEYLGYLLDELKNHFKGTNTITFIPYARPGGISHQEYTEKAAAAFQKIGIQVKGLHEYADPVAGIQEAEAFFTGGGNTFLLLKQLYKGNQIQALKEKIEAGTPYLGCSAGSNIAGISISTTNDMPITYPPSFDSLGVIPMNINPHYLDPIKGSTHMGETRETRINEFHTLNPQPVIGLREGSWLEVKGQEIYLRGHLSAPWFTPGNAIVEIPTGEEITHTRM